ncbi:putative baseplate assembly protein [Saccharothrix algeriensis]|uniref:Phage baseplate assembly protein n=1 Tax=Saccharothrix algeriensis TaxID=173560 RepID=A0A8T8HXR1_9PSEU|nr:putative baseplate assembly protein [Saccharothrix algeriensis]MBM7815037.1 putative phage baseplate assembly protein [Saccharothrix algeriensis]QTR03286.1 putative baseplate assembly protein [Saccharothrix algeriensis]
MVLPAPNLDDRRFQQLVDEAKHYVQRSCPEWSDHNVSDPGVTLIETFAHMVDQLVYRLNRVPDKNYLAFLDLLGVRLFPPTAARAEVTFWLSAPQPETVLLPPGTEVATVGGDTAEAVVFATTDELPVVPCSLTRLVTRSAGGDHADRTRDLEAGKDVPCFQARPAVGDATLFGLSAAVPRCAVVLRLDSRVEGVGVDPRQPPLVWEAWDGQGWAACATDEDSTGGLNRPGEVVLHVPAGHTESAVGGHRAGWLRCRVTEPLEDQPFYAESPTVREAEAFTIGGTTTVEHAEVEADVLLGESAGVPGQRFTLPTAPVLLDRDPVVVQVATGAGWEDWSVVGDFGSSGPDDRHVVLDASGGEVLFPPAVREADGSLRRYGAVPPKGAVVRVPRYRTGGGREGNVARGAISVLRSSEPYVSEVENREAATGGVDAETVAEAKVRVPHQLRVQERAVTAADYELIARQAVPSLARVRCLPVDGEPGGARVLLVPDAVADEGDRLRFEQLVPSDEVLAAVARRLDECRLLGTRLVVEPPRYQGITVVARLVTADPAVNRVREAALSALNRYLDPLRGGPDGTGWAFGRSVQFGEVFAVLQRVGGVDLVEEVRLFPANPITGARGAPVEHLELEPNALVFSHQHQVAVGAP